MFPGLLVAVVVGGGVKKVGREGGKLTAYRKQGAVIEAII